MDANLTTTGQIRREHVRITRLESEIAGLKADRALLFQAVYGFMSSGGNVFPHILDRVRTAWDRVRKEQGKGVL